MKLARALSTAVLSLTFGVGVPVYAQQEQHEQQEGQKDKAAQETEKKVQPEKPAKEDKNARQEDKTVRPEDRNTKPEEKKVQQQRNGQEEKNAQEHMQQAKPEQQEQRAGGNRGGRIPEDRYKANFGQNHRFHVSQSDYSNRRFQYGGYWFGFEGQWPSNWLYTQDVFVVEIDGVYYLCNASYPGVNIALSVTL